MLDNTDFNFDLDGDGIDDAMMQELDLTGDGTPDAYQFGFDTDGNGVSDAFSTVIDSDIDGVMDSAETFFDPDENGTFDYAEVDQLVDTNGDLQFDTLIHGIDGDIDGVIDSYETYDYEDIYGEDVSFDNVDIEEDPIDGLYIDELDNFDPSEANPDDVYGDPDDAMAEWEFQGDTNRCALYSQKFIIDEMTGQDVDIEEIADLSEENGWFSEDSGTNLLDMNRVLDHYGVENEMSFGNDLDDLVDCLEGGGKAIVSIDADEIWFGENDDIFTPGDGPNHAVEVIGIDNSDPDNPMVILNDSGNPNGCGEMVPADVFMDAWEDGDCQMIDVPEV